MGPLKSTKFYSSDKLGTDLAKSFSDLGDGSHSQVLNSLEELGLAHQSSKCEVGVCIRLYLSQKFFKSNTD